MNSWISSENRKVHQRKLNQVMRRMNEIIENDNLWKGRFICRQFLGQWYRYGDSSEHYYWVGIILVDKKTGQYKLLFEEDNHFCFLYHLFWEMNKFITEDCKVWEKDDPRNDTTDYRSWGVNVTGDYRNIKVDIVKS